MRKNCDELSEDRKELINLKNQLLDELAEAPKGRLRISCKANKTEYYCCETGDGTSGISGKYLRKESESLIRALAQKEYNQKLLAEVSRQIRMLEGLPKGIDYESLESVYYRLKEHRKRLVQKRTKSSEEKISEWLSISYEPKGFSEDAPEIYTEAGERVRSKSEKLIADKLRLMGIPYKYECPMKLAGYGTVYPDFTLLNKNTMKQAVLEHFGKMDDSEYAACAVAKVRSYEKSGLYVGKNLYLTFETTQSPFDARSLEAMLEDFT